MSDMHRAQRTRRRPSDRGVVWHEARQGYAVAAEGYLRPNLRVEDVPGYTEMLLELGGHSFCMQPGVDWSLRRSIAHFGALDHFFSELVNLERELAQGRCSLPRALLTQHGLTVRDFADGSAPRRPGYAGFMSFWFNRYLPQLKHEAAEFCAETALPPGLARLREACRREHARVERAFRDHAFDYRAASAALRAAAPEREATGAQDSELRDCA